MLGPRNEKTIREKCKTMTLTQGVGTPSQPLEWRAKITLFVSGVCRALQRVRVGKKARLSLTLGGL